MLSMSRFAASKSGLSDHERTEWKTLIESHDSECRRVSTSWMVYTLGLHNRRAP